MTFQKGVKFRIYPNREQRNLIDRTLGCSRLIYNKGLAMREDAFKSGEKCGYKQTSAMLTALKQDVNYAFLKEVDSIALQQALRNLDTGYTNFFEHRGCEPAHQRLSLPFPLIFMRLIASFASSERSHSDSSNVICVQTLLPFIAFAA